MPAVILFEVFIEAESTSREINLFLCGCENILGCFPLNMFSSLSHKSYVEIDKCRPEFYIDLPLMLSGHYCQVFRRTCM